MPKRSRSGVVSSPVRVVAPTRVNGGRSSVSVRAPGALADDDVQAEVLERRIEDLLDRAVDAVDLVDEEDVLRVEPREDRRHVALPLERRPCDRADPDVELLPDDRRERRLPEARWADEENMVERVSASLGSLEGDLELLLRLVPGR